MLEHVSLPEAVGRALRHRILNNELPGRDAARRGEPRGRVRRQPRHYPRRHAQPAGRGPDRHRSAPVQRRDADVDEDAEDVCYARYMLEDASLMGGVGAAKESWPADLRLALEQMSVGARDR